MANASTVKQYNLSDFLLIPFILSFFVAL